MRPDRRLNRLLARGRFARPEQEQLLEALLHGVTPPPRRRWLPQLAWAVPVLAALALLPAGWSRLHLPAFRAKGDAVSGPAVEASCAHGCAVGATLVYRVDELREPVWLAAFAVDDRGQRTWHFPSASGELPRVGPSTEPTLLPRGIRLDAPGAQTLQWLLLRRPLGRDQITALGVAAPDLVARGSLRFEVAP